MSRYDSTAADSRDEGTHKTIVNINQALGDCVFIFPNIFGIYRESPKDRQVARNRRVGDPWFKVMTGVYYTRDKICKFDNTALDKCLKCNQYSDSFMHTLWY